MAFRLSDAIGSRQNEEFQLSPPNNANREFGPEVAAATDGGFYVVAHQGTNSGECITNKIDYSGNTTLHKYSSLGQFEQALTFMGYSNSCDDSFSDRIATYSVPLAFSDGSRRSRSSSDMFAGKASGEPVVPPRASAAACSVAAAASESFAVATSSTGAFG